MAARFSIAPFGPIHLRRLLRARMDSGERLVGFAVGHLRPTPAQIAAQVGLALVPGVGQLAALAIGALGSDPRRLVVLTTRRVLLLKLDRSGPDPSGRGVLADLPLATLDVAYAPAPAQARPAAPPVRGRLRRASRRRATRARIAAQATGFTLTDTLADARIDFTIPQGGGGAAARLREALVLLAENPPPPPPYNHVPPAPPTPPSAAADAHGPAHMPRVTPTTARRGGILGPDRAATPRPPHPPAVRRRIQL